MQEIFKIIDEIISKRQLKENPKALLAQALQDPEVQQFLRQNQNKISKEMIADGLTNIYLFVNQRHNSHSATPGYQPELYISGKTIALRFKKSQEKLQAEKKKRELNNLHLIDLPAKLHGVKLQDLDKSAGRKQALFEIANFLKGFVQNPHQKGLYLSGDFGVGKTYMLAGLANRIAAMDKEVIFLHVPTFISGLASHFDDHSLPQRITRLAETDVLILDDIGAETLSQWSRDDVLGVILQQRMDNVLPTFFSSNFDMAKLQQHFAQTKNAIDPVKAARLMQRVRFLAKEVVISGPNRRS